MSVNQRIEEIINCFGLNKNSFSKKLGLSNNVTIGNIISGRKSKPSFEIIQKILQSFDSINPEWLITGEGEMLKTSSSLVNEPVLGYKTTSHTIDIPVFKNSIILKSGTKNNKPDGLISFPSFLLDSHSEYICFQADTNILSSIVDSGDFLVAQSLPKDEWVEISDGQVCAICELEGNIIIDNLKFSDFEESFLLINEKKSNKKRVHVKNIESIWVIVLQISNKTNSSLSNIYKRLITLEDKFDQLQKGH